MSNEPKHTATPWEIKGNVLFQKGTTKTIATVHIQNNFDSVRGKLVKDTESEANAARIVQCVNEYDGLIETVESLRAENTELIEALFDLSKTAEYCSDKTKQTLAKIEKP